MNNYRIGYLNQLLLDAFGRSPAGGPVYKWIHSRDEELFCYIGRLESVDTKAAYEHIPQVWEKRWVLAKWMEPPSAASWEMQFRGQVAHPRGGYYAAVATPSDKLLERGVEPTERITLYIIGLRKKQIELGRLGIMNAYKERQAYHARESERHIDDALTDRWTNCLPVVPGASPEHFA